MMTYAEYKEQERNRVNDLPVFWAFSNKQFREAMEARGLTENDTDKIYRLGNGGFYLRSDSEKVRAYFNRKSELPELLKDYDFAFDAFYYEMCNHEYGINYQRYWDVFGCFSDKELPFYDEDYDVDPRQRYAKLLKWDSVTIQAYKDAEKKYYKDADEKGWY